MRRARAMRGWRVLGAVLACSLSVAACGSGDDDADVAATGPLPSTIVRTEATTPATTLPPTTLPPTTLPATTLPATTESTTTIATPEPIPIEPPEGMELMWSDEFDGDAVDGSNWTYDIGGWGWGNGEAQYYTDRPENARTQNGLLLIELRQEKYEDSYYTSARLKSQGLREFQYGRIEARIKVPKGAGTWPAFWMLGADFDGESDDPTKQWPNIGEIDIMEYVGREPDLVLGTLHGPGYAGAGGRSQWNRQEFEIGDDFHTFAVDWDAEGIRWFFDGEMYFEVGPVDLKDREWVFDRPFFIILNLAVGGTLGGSIALDLEFPIQYYVDYVRVYQAVGDS